MGSFFPPYDGGKSANLVFAFAFSVVGNEMLLGVKWQIAKLVRKDGVRSSTLAEQQEKRDDCREKQNIRNTV